MSRPTNWPQALPVIQKINNNIPFASTKKSPNELVYGILSNRSINLILLALPSIPKLTPF